MIKVITLDDINYIQDYIDYPVFLRMSKNQVRSYESYEQYDVFAFEYYIKEKDALTKLIVVLNASMIIFVCVDVYIKTRIEGFISELDTIEPYHLFIGCMHKLLSEDYDDLDHLEEEITLLEDTVLTKYNAKFLETILFKRKVLLKRKRSYEQLSLEFSEWLENEHQLLDHNMIHLGKILNNKVDRLYNHVLSLRDYITQVREAYQAQIDIEQNNLMKVFTVVTTTFLPLTLIAGWYGMNLKMPEFAYDWMYPVVVFTSIVIVIGTLYYFKKKRWF